MAVEKEDPIIWQWRQSKTFMVYLFVVSVVLKAAAVLWWRPRRIESHFAKQGIRGPPYRFLVGNVKELVGLMVKASSQPMPFNHNILPRVLSFYHHWKKLYGATFLVWFGPTPRITVSDPDLIREILASKSQLFEKKEAHPLVKRLEGNGLLNLQGQKWAHHRKIISPSFHLENIKLSIPAVATSVVEKLEKWSDMLVSDTVEIEVSEWFQNLAEGIITRTAFGSSYEEGQAIFKLQAEQMALAAEAFQKAIVPGYRFIPTKKHLSFWKLENEIRRSLTRLINRRRLEESSGNHGSPENCPSRDLLGVMIRASGARQSPELGRSPAATMTVHDVVEECKSFFFAGKQTLSSLLTWTTVLLAMHPHWQALARDEVLQVCGSREVPGKDDVGRLKTLGMIVKESLRLYPPIIATIRRAKADVELGGCYKVPRGTEVMIPTLAVHHDQAIWGGDADEFNPGRFGGEGLARAAAHPVGFMPFGFGPRSCIGQSLAMVQAKLVLAIILPRFSFGLAPTYRHAPTVLMLLHPQYGAPIVFQNLCPSRPS